MYYVYIMTNQSHSVLYTGVTNDIVRRVWEHKSFLYEGFTKRYRTNQLVYYTDFIEIRHAIQFEKQVKGWKRSKKIALIESLNPQWEDLALAFE